MPTLHEPEVSSDELLNCRRMGGPADSRVDLTADKTAMKDDWAPCRLPDDVALANRRYQRECLKQRTIGRAFVPLPSILGNRHKRAFGILAYHRVAPRASRLPVIPWNVTPNRFRGQLHGLLRKGYQAWPLRKVLSHHAADEPIPRKTFVVTFDDGYENVFQFAAPILAELNVPATVFLATAYIGDRQPFPFDALSAGALANLTPDVWRPLSIDQCEAMLRGGLVELGTHTHTHRDFRNDGASLQEDLGLSQSWLRTRLGIDRPTFALPYGFSDHGIVEVAKLSGVVCCLTTQADLVMPGVSPFEWGRFEAEQYDTAGTIAAKLSGWYSFARNAWRRVRYGEERSP